MRPVSFLTGRIFLSQDLLLCFPGLMSMFATLAWGFFFGYII